MNDCVYRQAAIDEIKKCRFVVDAVEKIRELPSAEVEPVKRGKWIKVGDSSWECSVCHEVSCCEGNYCPDCGAKMEGAEE